MSPGAKTLSGSTRGAKESAGKIAHPNQTSMVFLWNTKYIGRILNNKILVLNGASTVVEKGNRPLKKVVRYIRRKKIELAILPGHAKVNRKEKKKMAASMTPMTRTCVVGQFNILQIKTEKEIWRKEKDRRYRCHHGCRGKPRL